MKTKWIVVGVVVVGLVAWLARGGCNQGSSTSVTEEADAGSLPIKQPTGADASTKPTKSIEAVNNECNIQTAPLNDATLSCPESSGFVKCSAGTKCCPKGASTCVSGDECSTGKKGFECFSSAQCANSGGICCAFAQKTASMWQPCTKPQITFDSSESSTCTTLANCPKSEPKRVRLCPKVGTAEGCDPSETCKERFTYLQGFLLTINVCE